MQDTALLVIPACPDLHRGENRPPRLPSRWLGAGRYPGKSLPTWWKKLWKFML